MIQRKVTDQVLELFDQPCNSVNEFETGELSEVVDLVVCPYCYGPTEHIYGKWSFCRHCRNSFLDPETFLH